MNGAAPNNGRRVDNHDEAAQMTMQRAPRPYPEPLADVDVTRSLLDARVQARLAEDSGKWTLTVSFEGPDGEQLAADLATCLAALRAADVRLDVTPNLVPGDPFRLDDIRVVAGDDAR